MASRSIPTGFHAHKYHALGNDYLVVDPEEFEPSLSVNAISALCDRNRGLGSDGILYGPLPPADDSPSAESAAFSLRIFNPDGSEAEKSGNGLRIFALYLYESGRVDEAPFRVMTKGGPVECRILPGEGGERSITVAMGKAQFLQGSLSLSFEGVEYRAVRVSMGNPHCVLMGPSPSPEMARHIGPLVERHPDFPNRTNVQFLEVLDRKQHPHRNLGNGGRDTRARAALHPAPPQPRRSTSVSSRCRHGHMPEARWKLICDRRYKDDRPRCALSTRCFLLILWAWRANNERGAGKGDLHDDLLKHHILRGSRALGGWLVDRGAPCTASPSRAMKRMRLRGQSAQNSTSSIFPTHRSERRWWGCLRATSTAGALRSARTWMRCPSRSLRIAPMSRSIADICTRAGTTRI